LEEKAEENKKKTQEFQKKQRQERKKLFEASPSSPGFGMGDVEKQLRQLEGEYTDSEEEEELEEQDEDDEQDLGGLEQLYCVACDKLCKSFAAKENHETSRKHKDNLQKLIEEMQGEAEDEEEEEDSNASEDDEDEKSVETEVEVIRCAICDETFKTEDAKSKHEASKKHRKNMKLSEKKGNAKGKEDAKSDGKENEKSTKKKGKEKTKNVEKETEDEIKVNVASTQKDIEDPESEKENLDNMEENSAEDELDEDPVGREKILKKSDITKENFSCAKCRAKFPSKTKLFNHLKTSGHAVHIPEEGAAEEIEGQKKKKRNRK